MEKKAVINIEIVEKGPRTEVVTSLEGTTYLIMQGLANAIKELEKCVPEKNRGNYKTDILKMLNDRD